MWPLHFTGETAPMVPISPVNYRGSLGFGQASIRSLLSRVGEQDVADTQVRGAGMKGRTVLMGGCCWWGLLGGC